MPDAALFFTVGSNALLRLKRIGCTLDASLTTDGTDATDADGLICADPSLPFHPWSIFPTPHLSFDRTSLKALCDPMFDEARNPMLGWPLKYKTPVVIVFFHYFIKSKESVIVD